MNKNKDIESFLRNNKPSVKDNPTFLLEVRQKMLTVEGIKAEVDRQRNKGRIALICALIAGLITGVVTILLAYLYPIDTEAISKDIISEIRLIIEPWKYHIMVVMGGSAVVLAIIAGVVKDNRQTF